MEHKNSVLFFILIIRLKILCLIYVVRHKQNHCGEKKIAMKQIQYKGKTQKQNKR